MFLIQANPEALGVPLYNSSSALPYLFKVLSVAKALSVQAHPDRTRAAVLHKTLPQHYKDDNHKPEMTCALTPFEAMCAFRGPSDLVAHIRSCPELISLLSADSWSSLQSAETSGNSETFKLKLRYVFSEYMNAS